MCIFETLRESSFFPSGSVTVVGSFPLGQKAAEWKPFGCEQEPSGILLNGLFMATTRVDREVSEVRAQLRLRQVNTNMWGIKKRMWSRGA